MAGTIRDSFIDLERRRLSLERNVAKLRASLQYWQACEIEYEGMKEDILRLGDKANAGNLDELGEDAHEPAFPGQDILLSSKERRLLLRDDKGRPREKQQVLGLITRRVDYVQQNVRTIVSQLQTAEEKFAASQVLIQPEARNEEGLPLTEIFEELDAEGNAITGSTSEPGLVAPQVVEALRKAGITEFPAKDVAASSPANVIDESSALGDSTPKDSDLNTSRHQEAEPRKPISGAPAAAKANQRSYKPRKSVSFAEGTKNEVVSDNLGHPNKDKIGYSGQTRSSMLGTNATTQDSVSTNEKPSIRLYDGAEEKPFDPVIPTNESPEDAALRREMIEYNMGEVGSIVAELDVDEDEGSYSDDGSGKDDDDNSSIEEEEDKFGRTNRRVLTDDYVTEMRKLQQRLKNMGPMAAQSVSLAVDHDGIRQEHDESTISEVASRSLGVSATKGVRFANELDVQEAPTKPPADDPVPASSNNDSHAVGPKPIHTPTVIERPFNTTSSSEPTEPDEFDPILLRQEVATEYHRMRNHFIQKQGGFRAREEHEEKGEMRLTEAEGGSKKISRFKAARIGKLAV